MNIRITRSVALVLTVICLATIVLLNRYSPSAEAMAQQEKNQKWEYCFVSSPLQVGTAGGISTKVYVYQGGEKLLADSDSTGVTPLNKLGAEGWELVSASDDHTYSGPPMNQPPTTRFVLKRLK